MPLENLQRVTSEALGRGKPRAAIRTSQWYLVETPDGEQTYVQGKDLVEQPAPVKVHAIAWRV